MSHFSVIVIGDDVEGQLAPYHEFECTGENDEWVQTIDRTQEARENYKTAKRSVMKDTEGKYHDKYDKKFYRDATEDELKERSYETKKWFCPEGYTEMNIPAAEFQSFTDYVKYYYDYKTVALGETPDIEGPHKYGYIVVDDKGEAVQVMRRTNPNRKWDWYSMGGRWTGYFKLKSGATSGQVGQPGAFGNKGEAGWVDQALKGDIDIKAMREAEAKKAGETFDKFEPAFKGKKFPIWKDILVKHGVGKDGGGDIQAARNEFNNHPVTKALSAIDTWITFRNDELSEYFCNGNRAQFIENATRGAISSYAVVKDGKWYQKGEMGWFGMASDEKAQEKWDEEFARLINDLPEDTMLTVIDCHI